MPEPASAVPPFVCLRDVRKAYRAGYHEVEALAGLSLQLRRGELLAIMGPSGSGKTTLLNILGLLDKLDSGSYELDGRDVRGLPDEELAYVRNRRIGFVFQSFNLIPDLDVFDNVDVPLRYRRLSAPERKRRIDAALERVGLTARARHLPGQLSGGQQQRVAIARAIVAEPELLLADEPTGNLDTLTARDVLQILEDINRAGTTIVMVTHNPEIAARAHRRVHVLDGKLIDPHRPEPLRVGGAAP